MTSSQVRTFMSAFLNVIAILSFCFLWKCLPLLRSHLTTTCIMPHPNHFYDQPDLLPITIPSVSSRNGNLHCYPLENFNWDMTQFQEPEQGEAEETLFNQEQESENTKYSKAIAESVTEALLDLVRVSITQGSPSRWPEVDRHEKAMVSKISAQLDWRGLIRILPDHPASKYTFRATARRGMPQYPYDVSLWVHCSPADPAEQVRRGRSTLVDQPIC
jgi:hypothetical protein